MLSTLAVDNFSLPGDAGFPLNSLYHAPASKMDAGEFSFLISACELPRGFPAFVDLSCLFM